MRSSECCPSQPLWILQHAIPRNMRATLFPLWFHNQVEYPSRVPKSRFRAFHLMHSLDFNGMHKLHSYTLPELTVKLATSAQLLLHLTAALFNYRRPEIPNPKLLTRNPTSFTLLTKSVERIAKKEKCRF